MKVFKLVLIILQFYLILNGQVKVADTILLKKTIQFSKYEYKRNSETYNPVDNKYYYFPINLNIILHKVQ